MWVRHHRLGWICTALRLKSAWFLQICRESSVISSSWFWWNDSKTSLQHRQTDGWGGEVGGWLSRTNIALKSQWRAKKEVGAALLTSSQPTRSSRSQLTVELDVKCLNTFSPRVYLRPSGSICDVNEDGSCDLEEDHGGRVRGDNLRLELLFRLTTVAASRGGRGTRTVWLQQDAEVPLTARAKNRHLRVDLKVSGGSEVSADTCPIASLYYWRCSVRGNTGTLS